MNRRARRAGAAALSSLAALTGCGTSSLSTRQLQAAAGRSCTIAGSRLSRIEPPASPGGARSFLSRGIAALASELAALHRLAPDPAMATSLVRARAATARELTALRLTLNGLTAGNDPVVAIKTLQQQLIPAEREADSAWHALDVPSCADS